MITESLKKYIEEEILPNYKQNDEGHNLSHIKYVIRRSLKFANEVENINLDMVYTIAAYHDICIHVSREEHEHLSAQYLMNDINLKKFFNDEQIKIMSEAVEDHRASSSNEPRSIYGKIVSSADRNTLLEQPFKRTFAYKLKKEYYLTLEDLIDRAYEVLMNKFGPNGYAREKMYFDDSEYQNFLDELNIYLKDKELFINKFYEINKIDSETYELNRVRKLCEEVRKLADTFNLEYFFVTEGASSCHIEKNEAVRNARQKHEEWEQNNGFDSKHDWSDK